MIMDTARIEEFGLLARETATQAGNLLEANQATAFDITKKGRINLVTEMDLRSERLIVDSILVKYPSHQILAEEKGIQGGNEPVRWIIDPLDGTTNYAHGYRFYCVSIGVEVEGTIVAGSVYDPVTRECFWAVKNQGAYLNEHRIHVSTEDQLIDSLISTGFSYDESRVTANLEHFKRVIYKTRAVRRDGAAALDLCYVACGRFDGFWELTLHPWDVAAGLLIVQESGGMITRLDGNPCSIDDQEFLATNGRIHSALSRLLC